jgi:hypothetical protein
MANMFRRPLGQVLEREKGQRLPSDTGRPNGLLMGMTKTKSKKLMKKIKKTTQTLKETMMTKTKKMVRRR